MEMSNSNFLQTIKDAFDEIIEIAAARAEREESARIIAEARAEAAAAAVVVDDDDGLDAVAADDDAEYEEFHEVLYPSAAGRTGACYGHGRQTRKAQWTTGQRAVSQQRKQSKRWQLLSDGNTNQAPPCLIGGDDTAAPRDS